MKLLKINKIRDVPTKVSTKFGLFAGLMIIQQIIALIGSASAYTQIIGILLVFLAFYLGKKTIEFCLSYKPNNQTLPNNWLKATIKQYALLFITMFCYNIAYTNLIYATDSTSTNQTNLASMMSKPLSYIFLIGFTLIIAPFIEEFCFRYLFLNKYLESNDKRKTYIMIILSSLCFALLHLTNQPLSTPILEWLKYLGQYTILGLFFANNYVNSKSYKQSVALHITWNTSAFILMLLF